MKKLKLIEISQIKTNLISSRQIKLKIPVETIELKIGMLKSGTLIEPNNETVQQEKSRIYKVTVNDIIIKRISPLFATLVLEDKDMSLGANLICIRLKKEFQDIILPSYLACYLDSNIASFTRETSTMPLLKIQLLENFEIPIIDKDRQKILGEAWKINNIQYEENKLLIVKKFEYIQNLIRKSLEEL